MEPDLIKQLIAAKLPECDISVSGENGHFEVRAVGDIFADKSMVAKQQLIYATVNEHITSGAIHALTIKTYTPSEWKTAQKLQVQ
ncbi:Acid stress protein IbaG [hydrothermal vent metagenome]|uniref:Acid stress protein IbaG n=1 Tax=hydrothermal vent metagenome TaxID=652676 RepID=A0A3B1ACC9_9ZZZZ